MVSNGYLLATEKFQWVKISSNVGTHAAKGYAMNVADLLKPAETATPDVQPTGKKWATMLPVFIELRNKGFSRRQSIDWLVKQGAAKVEDKERAIKAFDSLLTRRKKAGKIIVQQGSVLQGL